MLVSPQLVWLCGILQYTYRSYVNVSKCIWIFANRACQTKEKMYI